MQRLSGDSTLVILRTAEITKDQDHVQCGHSIVQADTVVQRTCYLFTRTKLKVFPVALVTASRMYSNVGVHGLARRCTPEKEYMRPASPYVACFRGILCSFPNTKTLVSSSGKVGKN